MRLVLVALVVTACGQGTTLETSSSAITGGSLDDADPAVVGLVAQAPLCGADGTSAQLFCTGLLIAPRVVLTAGHCTTTYPLAGSRVYAGTSVVSDPGQWLAVAAVRRHPAWTADNPRANDIALLVLEEPASIDPILPIETPLDDSLVGATVRVIGFGMDDAGDVGRKRQGTATVTAIGTDTFDIAAAPAMTCEGDSGGPVLIDVGGVTRVAGVTSFGDFDCTVGTNTRVDEHLASFIAPVLAEVAASPGPRASITPGLDTCASACASDADCPRGMTCLSQANAPNACALNGLPPGRFGQRCAAGGCPGDNCVDAGDAGCLCYEFCDAASGGGGCAVGGRLGDFSGWLTIVAIVVLVLRRRILGLLALATLFLACSEPRGNCPKGAVPRGAAPPKATLQFCEEQGHPGVRSGPFVEWYADKTPPQKKRAGSYKHGKLDGAWVSYDRDGKLEREDTYADGILEGRAVEYYPSGGKKEEGIVEHGIRVGTWTLFYESGNPWKQTSYSDNSNTQRWTVWSDGGSKTHEGVFVNGQKHGVFTEYFASGQKASQGTWSAGKKQGTWTTWDEQGKLVSEQTFADGELLSAAAK